MRNAYRIFIKRALLSGQWDDPEGDDDFLVQMYRLCGL
jgi:hypothetical protein